MLMNMYKILHENNVLVKIFIFQRIRKNREYLDQYGLRHFFVNIGRGVRGSHAEMNREKLRSLCHYKSLTISEKIVLAVNAAAPLKSAISEV